MHQRFQDLDKLLSGPGKVTAMVILRRMEKYEVLSVDADFGFAVRFGLALDIIPGGRIDFSVGFVSCERE